MSVRLHMTIRGRVQGVCYRMCARDEAARLKLCGWVRNRGDGSVETVAEGPDAAVAAFESWCRKGPSMARVTGVSVDYGEATGEFDGFRILPTGF